MVHPISFPVQRWRMPRAAQSALLAASLLTTLTAQAQPAGKAARSDPLDPMAAVPALRYEPSFAQYRRLGDEKPVSWRDANDTVTRIGGWRVYAREAQQPDAASPTTPAASAALTPAVKPAETPPTAKPMPMPMPAGHGGHKSP
jgi:hypothetical protein